MEFNASWLSAWASIGSLSIAIISLILAGIALRRTVVIEQPYAWLQLEKLSTEWFIAVLTLKNPSRLDLNFEKITISLPDFRMANYSDAFPINAYGSEQFDPTFRPAELSIGMPPPGGHTRVAPGDTMSVKFLIFQPSHSRQKTVRVGAHFHLLVSRPKWRASYAIARTRTNF